VLVLSRRSLARTTSAWVPVSSDRILPALSPGINVLTIHPRYWSFYSWVLDDFWSADLSRNRAAFVSFYRPREAVFFGLL